MNKAAWGKGIQLPDTDISYFHFVYFSLLRFLFNLPTNRKSQKSILHEIDPI